MPTIQFSGIKNITESIKKDLETAEYRTINEITKKAVTMLARDTASSEGYKISEIKRRLKIKKAYLGSPQSIIQVSGKRLQFPGLRTVKKKGKPAGISFFSEKKTIRKVITEPIQHKSQQGSKPFIIKGKNSGKNIAVFVDPAFVNTKSERRKGQSNPRKVVTFAGPSLPHLVKGTWQQKVQDFCLQEMPKELARQRDKIRRQKGLT